MKRKWLLIVSVMMALVLALSLCLVGCNKGDDNNEDGPGFDDPVNPGDPEDPVDPTPTPGTANAVALIEDESLEGKFFMMYTFEESEAVSAAPGEDTVLAAYDPYTGEAIPDYDGHYYSGGEALVSVPKANGGSKYVMNVNKNAIGLGKVTSSDIKDTVDSTGLIVADGEHTGLSVSFWAYNYETLVGELSSTGGLQADWSNIMTNGQGNKIAYGNIYVDTTLNSMYPGAATVVGRGAYTEDSYAEAQQALTTSQLGFHNDYTAWNAVAGNKGASDEDGGLIDTVAKAYLNNWRYITVNLDYEGGLSYYVNGRLAFNYPADAFTGNKYPEFYRNYVVGMLSDYASMGNFYVDMFNAEAGLYADDVLVGASLTAEEACNLYEDLSGTTYEADDLTLSGVNSATVNQSAYAYSSTWWQLNDSGVPAWSQITIPAGDFSLTYTADLYTAGSGWNNLNFCLYEGAQRTTTPGTGDGQPALVYITMNDYRCVNMVADDVASTDSATKNQTPKITYTKEYTDGAFAVGLGDALYTKSEEVEGSTTVTNLCQDVAFDLVAVITKTGNTLTVAYYEGSAEAANLVYGFSMQFTTSSQLTLAIGGENTYLENITVTSITTSDSTTPTLSSTTSGARALVDTTGYTPVTTD